LATFHQVYFIDGRFGVAFWGAYFHDNVSVMPQRFGRIDNGYANCLVGVIANVRGSAGAAFYADLEPHFYDFFGRFRGGCDASFAGMNFLGYTNFHAISSNDVG
jgi:hypothetical protein